MKKLFAFLLALTMIFALAACGDSKNNSTEKATSGTDNSSTSQQGGQTDNSKWPSISYLKDSDKYTGDGKITQVKEWDASGENSMWTIYYNDATFDSVESYVANLVAAGWTNYYADEDGNYMEDKSDKGTARAYYCASDYAEVEIQIADFSNSMSFTDGDEFSFNLKIQFSKL